MQHKSFFFNKETIKKFIKGIDWKLLFFLIFLLNVKLVIKLAAIAISIIFNWKEFSLNGFFRQRSLFFYFSLAGIGVINYCTKLNTTNNSYLILFITGLSFWLASAIIAYQLKNIVQKNDSHKLHNTISAFFILHITTIFINLSGIIIKTGSINPYTYKGLNQKYFISTGDFITGITFDTSVCTAFICVFGLVYFLYRNKFILSLACMAALLIMGSNFTNLILVSVLIWAAIFYSNKLQKSIIIIQIAMLIIFMTKVSPQNSEHVKRTFYQAINKPYDSASVKATTLGDLKKRPDSLLTIEQIKSKYAITYIDSVNEALLSSASKKTDTIAKVETKAKDSSFYKFHESSAKEEEINQYTSFLSSRYSTEKRDSLKKAYDWRKPGKWIAAEQLFSFYKENPQKMWIGNGIGNFSSRMAFKATSLCIAGTYPKKFTYINNDFLDNHLYLYLYYHSQDQSHHEAKNTPDSSYYQILGEYGILAIALLGFLYFGYFFRRIQKRSYGLPLLLILAGAFFVEYWFEQLSIVILFELLLFLEIKNIEEVPK